MPYDPDKHHRRSIRLQGYDYTQEGMYFVTISAHQRKCVFGDVIDSEMHLNGCGQIVQDEWIHTGARSNVELDIFVVMPNHTHGIIILTAGDATQQDTPPQKREFGKPIAGSLGTIVNAFKSAVTRRINLLRDTPGAPVWQRNYHEHIIRDEKTYRYIFNYVLNNPALWEEDRLYNPE